jgi:hypothetical protein
VMHLTERMYRLLLQGLLPSEEARALACHLEEECAICEEFLASRPSADAVDGLVDEGLGALVPAGERGSDLDFARIERRLRERAPAPRGASRRLAPAALAAAVLAAGLAALVVPRGGAERAAWDGVKGPAPRALPVRLRFLVVTPAPGGPPALEKGVSGQPVQAGASLEFEVESGRAAQAALLRVPTRGGPELFWSGRVLPGGSQITVGGRPAAYPLADLAGVQRFILVASEERLEPERLARAAAALAPPARIAADLPGLEGLSLDVVEVEVR